MAQLRDAHPAIQRLGAVLVVVGTGKPEATATFARELQLPFPLLADGDGDAARAAGLVEGSAAQIAGIAPVRSAFRAWRSGHRQHRTGPRPRQLGATFVIAPGSIVLYAHLDRAAGDHAPLAGVMAALA